MLYIDGTKGLSFNAFRSYEGMNLKAWRWKKRENGDAIYLLLRLVFSTIHNYANDSITFRRTITLDGEIGTIIYVLPRDS